ncbi:MAG: 30S ribosomal protein S8 [Holosporaceae bacterium]|jgi:small subunit ribosomal protein S8|nr:30S ribosomal protein S8 [Holosporaceae bacterium]
MMTDPISDMLARIKNACQRYFETVDIPSSKLKAGILRVLEREGYINGFKEVEKDNRVFLRVTLRYYDGKPVINVLDRVSKPSRRVYSKLKKISSVYNGFGIFVLSTSKGVMSDAEAKENNVGGEILCKVF